MARKMRVPHKLDTFALENLAEKLSLSIDHFGLVIVDHGSRRQESNEMLLQLVHDFKKRSPFAIVEPAHMELAAPSISDAFSACVAQSAQFVIVHPYFLFPGRHWNEDIPRLAAAAATQHAGLAHLVTAPLGLHPMMTEIIHARVADCLRHATGAGDACELCAEDEAKCRIVD